MKKLLLLGLVIWFCLPAAARADQGDQFWTDYTLRLEAEAGKLELVDSYVNPAGVYITNAWWFNDKQGVISQLIVLKDLFFTQPLQTYTNVDQPWLHEFVPGFTHNFAGENKVGEIFVAKDYTWFESQMMWEYRINRYYQHHDGKSFFRLHRGSEWIFWIIDPLVEVETPL
jgi:hypothetical protein